MAEDPHDLGRFLAAQDGVYPTALAELRAGAKRSHWMWFVFPQLAGLGHSAMAERYAIRSLAEAQAYLAHPVLGERLAACIAALAGLDPRLGAGDVLGGVDALKLRSSLTLFAEAGSGASAEALGRWFGGRPDERTLALLGRP